MCRVFCVHKFSTILGEYLGAWLLHHMVRLCLALYENAILCSKSLYRLPFSSAMKIFPVALHLCQHLVLSGFFVCFSFWDFNHSNSCVVIPHCCLNLWSPNIWCWTYYHMLIFHLCMFYEDVYIRPFVHFLKIGLLFFLMLGSKSSL